MIRFSFNRVLSKRILVYIPASLLPFLIDMLTVLFFVFLGFSNSLSFFIAALNGTTVSFVVNKFLVFEKGGSRQTKRELGLFIWLSLVAFLLGILPGLFLDTYQYQGSSGALLVRFLTLLVLWILKFLVLNTWVFPHEAR